MSEPTLPTAPSGAKRLLAAWHLVTLEAERPVEPEVQSLSPPNSPTEGRTHGGNQV